MRKLILLAFILIPVISFAQKKRIYQLTTEGTITSSHYLVVDKASFTQAKKVTVDELTSLEREEREAEDDSTRTGAGLDAGGGYSSDATTNYLTDADFAAVALDPSLKSADHILDSVLARVDSIQYCHAEFRLKAQINLNFVAGTWTKITDGNNDWDDDNIHCLSQSGDSIQVLNDGVFYMLLSVTDSMQIENDQVGQFDLAISKNGTILAYPATTSAWWLPDGAGGYKGFSGFQTTTYIVIESCQAGDWLGIHGRRRHSSNDISFLTGHLYIQRIE